MALLIGEIIDQACRMVPAALAGTLRDDAITFAQLSELADRTANALLGLGVRPGDRVAWWLGPSLRTMSGFVACARLGVAFAPLNPAYTPAEAAAVLEYLRPRLVVADPTHAVLVPSDHLLATVDGPGPGVDLDALTQAASAAFTPPASVLDTDPHIVYLTSGSTGTPKGVLVSHRASWLRAAPGGGTFTSGLRGRGGVVNTFPLFHYGGWHYVLEAWQNRTAAHIVPRADADSVIDAVTRRRPSALYCIPAVWERVLDPVHKKADLSSLLHADTGTSGVSPELVARIKERLPGTTTTILYGSTEAGRMAALQDWDLARKPHSVGVPAFPGALWLSAEGEVLIRGEALMSGYFDAPDATAAALDGGCYHSGDLGYLDDEGYLFLTGRTAEMIRTGGEFVAPVEVESVLRTLPEVLDVAVVGVPDPQWGEVVCAVLVLAPGAPVPSVEAVRAHAGSRLAAFKHPRRVEILPEIPRTAATGQLQRRAIRALLTRDEGA